MAPQSAVIHLRYGLAYSSREEKIIKDWWNDAANSCSWEGVSPSVSTYTSASSFVIKASPKKNVEKRARSSRPSDTWQNEKKSKVT